MSNETKTTEKKTEKVKTTKKIKAKTPSYCKPCRYQDCRNIQFIPELTKKCAYLHGHIASYVK